jgi:hypothetical protein
MGLLHVREAVLNEAQSPGGAKRDPLKSRRAHERLGRALIDCGDVGIGLIDTRLDERAVWNDKQPTPLAVDLGPSLSFELLPERMLETESPESGFGRIVEYDCRIVVKHVADICSDVPSDQRGRAQILEVEKDLDDELCRPVHRPDCTRHQIASVEANLARR